ncbi:flagellar basal body-associated protein FliL [Roseivivax lentus]|uniref:flagellar basal body-associated protein FliL n=1 Tax=Roseivivax lentus TaxID=633194 RepID=UPI001179FA6F|nr:flagellar basal body-associated protein FliL [Roseivivax lentus]
MGTGAGIGAAMVLGGPKETKTDVAETCPEPEGAGAAEPSAAPPNTADIAASETDSEYVKINNQFFVPVVDNERVVATVILSLDLEVAPGTSDPIFTMIPRLRDAFLRVLFDHANAGNFGVGYTENASLDLLRRNLLSVAQGIGGQTIRRVLITEIARQGA